MISDRRFSDRAAGAARRRGPAAAPSCDLPLPPIARRTQVRFGGAGHAGSVRRCGTRRFGSAAGTDAQIFDGAVDDPEILDGPVVALGNISRDDAVNGRWTLRVEGRAAGGQGDLDGWTLHIVSNFD